MTLFGEGIVLTAKPFISGHLSKWLQMYSQLLCKTPKKTVYHLFLLLSSTSPLQRVYEGQGHGTKGLN